MFHFQIVYVSLCLILPEKRYYVTISGRFGSFLTDSVWHLIPTTNILIQFYVLLYDHLCSRHVSAIMIIVSPFSAVLFFKKKITHC